MDRTNNDSPSIDKHNSITRTSVKNFTSDCNCAIFVPSYLYTAIKVSQEITVCETESLPTTFTLTCLASVTPAALPWAVTGIPIVGSRSITSGDTQGPFNYPTSSSSGEATFVVNDPTNMEVVNGTCFQCRDLAGSNLISTAVCVNVMREWKQDTQFHFNCCCFAVGLLIVYFRAPWLHLVASQFLLTRSMHEYFTSYCWHSLYMLGDCNGVPNLWSTCSFVSLWSFQQWSHTPHDSSKILSVCMYGRWCVIFLWVLVC